MTGEGLTPYHVGALDQTFLLLGSLAGVSGASPGAFGAHGLKTRLSAEMLAVFETGVRYQMSRARAVVSAAIGHLGSARLLAAAGWLFVAGIVLFSGSLYALALRVRRRSRHHADRRPAFLAEGLPRAFAAAR
jgi:uncharacterized membrane protein YgdD (TMEM256/DUF423 family)